ncbi:MAG: energy-coupling factor transporter transmembrane protein EcfT [bacterium]|nr:energy-coupling factor transporter transmembrane protein EcfT [bacterium]
MSSIILGTYIQGESILHRLDPRFKLIFALIYFAAVFTAPGFYGLILSLAFTMLFIALSKIPVGKIVKSVLPLIYILIFAAIINAFFTNEGTIYWHWGIFTISSTGLYNAAFYTIRLGILFIGMTLLTLTTSSVDITDASERLLGWLKAIKLPVHEICMMLGIALRFLPVFADEFFKIKAAQESRGATFSSGGLIKRTKALLPIAIPLMASAFRHAEGLTQAMESRCYHGAAGRTKLREMRLGSNDWMAMGVMALMLSGAIVMRVLL